MLLFLACDNPHRQTTAPHAALALTSKMYDGSGTVGRSANGQLADCAIRQIDAAYALTRWQHFSARKDLWVKD